MTSNGTWSQDDVKWSRIATTLELTGIMIEKETKYVLVHTLKVNGVQKQNSLDPIDFHCITFGDLSL